MEKDVPIQSMTGFGRAEKEFEGCPVWVELKSVNHRYCEIRVRLPRDLNKLEFTIRQQLQKVVKRGRVETNIRLGSESQDIPLAPDLDVELATQYVSLFRSLAETFSLEEKAPSTTQLFQLPGVLRTHPTPQRLEALTKHIQLLLEEALQPFLQMRTQEGAHLFEDINERLNTIEGHVTTIEASAPDLPEYHFARLQERLERFPLKDDIDQERLYQELAIWADRSDISEELTRLHSHLNQFRHLLQEGGVVGRRLDFLCQELHRESNTVGSKVHDAEITKTLIELKAEIEKVREQVQNIE